MHRYRVTHIQEGGQRVALKDSAGWFHVARVLTEPPEVGVVLMGALPGLGFRVVQCAANQTRVRLVFEELRLDLGTAQKLTRGAEAKA